MKTSSADMRPAYPAHRALGTASPLRGGRTRASRRRACSRPTPVPRGANPSDALPCEVRACGGAPGPSTPTSGHVAPPTRAYARATATSARAAPGPPHPDRSEQRDRRRACEGDDAHLGVVESGALRRGSVSGGSRGGSVGLPVRPQGPPGRRNPGFRALRGRPPEPPAEAAGSRREPPGEPPGGTGEPPPGGHRRAPGARVCPAERLEEGGRPSGERARSRSRARLTASVAGAPPSRARPLPPTAGAPSGDAAPSERPPGLGPQAGGARGRGGPPSRRGLLRGPPRRGGHRLARGRGETRQVRPLCREQVRQGGERAALPGLEQDRPRAPLPHPVRERPRVRVLGGPT